MTEQEPPGKALIGGGELASVTAAEHGNAQVVTIAGEVDISNVDRIAEAIHAQPNCEDGLIVDLSAVSYMDSSAISVLHDLAMRLRSRAQRLVVVSPPGTPPRRVLELTALDANAPVVDGLERAVRLLGDSALP